MAIEPPFNGQCALPTVNQTQKCGVLVFISLTVEFRGYEPVIQGLGILFFFVEFFLCSTPLFRNDFLGQF